MTYGLRPVVDDDHAWLVELHNDELVLRNLTHPQPITLAQHMAWWAGVSHDRRQLRLIFEVAGARAGFSKFYDIDSANLCCTLGADLHGDFRGKGLAKHMWTLMLQRAFDGMGLHRVGLTTAVFNGPARRTYNCLGFKEEGRLEQSLLRDGTFHDQVCMRLLRHEWASKEATK